MNFSIPSGVSWASFSDSTITGGCVVLKKVL